MFESYEYLGKNIELTKINKKADLSRRCSLAWAAFRRLQSLNQTEGKKINHYVLLVLTYEIETWAFNNFPPISSELWSTEPSE